MEEKKNVFLTLHKNFVRENIEYADRKTGEMKTFNSVTLPKGTMIGDTDVSYYQFSPRFVNSAKFRGENYRDIPLLADREVRLTKTELDEEGSPVLDEAGHQVKDTIKVMPSQLKEAIDKGNKEYRASLSDKAKNAREASENQTHEAREAEPVAR